MQSSCMHFTCIRRTSLLYHEHAPDGFRVGVFACFRLLDTWLELDGSRHMSWWGQSWSRWRSNGWSTWYDLRLLLEEARVFRLQFLKTLTIFQEVRGREVAMLVPEHVKSAGSS